MKINIKYKFIIVFVMFTLLQVGLLNTIISFAKNDDEQVIADGTYAIKSAINSNYALDVTAASNANKANVALYKYNEATNQQFKIKYLNNGYYQITAVHSGKALDVQASGKVNRTNVEQYKLNVPSTENQKWKIQKNTDGTYSFISECNGLYLDVFQGKAQNHANIQMHTKNNQVNQKFKIEAVDSGDVKVTGTKTIADGTYAIKSAINSNYTLDITSASTANKANVELYKYKGEKNQQFNIKYLNDGFYQITAVHSGKSLDVQANGKTNGTNVEQYKLNNPATKNQRWVIKQNTDGTYSFISECNGLYLDVYQGLAQNHANIQMYKGNNQKNQKFKIEKVTQNNNNTNTGNSIQGSKTIADGIYSIATAVSNNYVLDVEGGSKENRANIQIYEKQVANRQKFKVEYLGDGTYKIMAVYSSKVLDVQGDGKVAETNVCQYTPKNPIPNNEKWIIKEAGGGYYYIISKSSGLYLDLYGGIAHNGTNIQIFAGHGGNSQKFKFVQPSELKIDTAKYPKYKEKIEALMNKHPGWNFELVYTGLRFDDVIAGEASLHSRNLVPKSYGGEWVCPTCGTKLYDSGWYCASQKARAYYMDPRNFLDETNVFQFQDVNEYINGVCTLQGIQTKLNGTFLQNYATAVDNACKNQNVNPYYIIARVLQEQGSSGTTIGKGMPGGDGKTYYNPFNIGASGNGYDQIYANALATAKKNGWNTMQKALEGGIEFCKKNWLANYQNTLYLNKFDIDKRSGGSLYTHQYMQNLMAAYSESTTLRSMYANTNKLESNFTFIIPMYEGMSSTISQLPSNNQETSPINVQITANGGLWIRTEANEKSATIRLINKGEVILSVQRGVNSNWHKVITTDGKIGYMSGTYLKQVQDVTNCNYTAKVKTQDGIGCNIRVGPSTSLGLVTAIADNVSVTVINQGTYNNIDGYNWYRVRLSNGQQGFMPSKFLVK